MLSTLSQANFDLSTGDCKLASSAAAAVYSDFAPNCGKMATDFHDVSKSLHRCKSHNGFSNHCLYIFFAFDFRCGKILKA